MFFFNKECARKQKMKYETGWARLMLERENSGESDDNARLDVFGANLSTLPWPWHFRNRYKICRDAFSLVSNTTSLNVQINRWLLSRRRLIQFTSFGCLFWCISGFYFSLSGPIQRVFITLLFPKCYFLNANLAESATNWKFLVMIFQLFFPRLI